MIKWSKIKRRGNAPVVWEGTQIFHETPKVVVNVVGEPPPKEPVKFNFHLFKPKEKPCSLR